MEIGSRDTSRRQMALNSMPRWLQIELKQTITTLHILRQQVTQIGGIGEIVIVIIIVVIDSMLPLLLLLGALAPYPCPCRWRMEVHL